MAAYYSEIQICNKALARLSIPPLSSIQDTIDTNTESSKAALGCKLEYPIVLEQLLEDTVWSFATTRKVLDSPEILPPSFQYNYEYRIPFEMINIQKVYGVNTQFSMKQDDYEIENGFILSNSKELQVVYTRKLSSEAIKLASAAFIDVLSLKLAMALCMPLTENRTLYNDIATEFSNALENASGSDGAQSRNQKIRFNDLSNHR